MKPDQEMRADMDETDLEPCDVFADFGMVIVEGRTPGLCGRGYGEGPHCPRLSGQNKHQCQPQEPQCLRNGQFRKHMLLLWRNNIPMSIEVLLSPEPTLGNPKTQGCESQNVPELNYILLEQWTINMLPKRVPDVLITGKSLLHAVRSYLHFSQLSAWYSLSSGKIPQNVSYRICVPGEAFTNKFTHPPDTHTFPVANVGRNNAIKVTVKSMPRYSGIPSFLSTKRDKCESFSKDAEASKLNMACALSLPEDCQASDDERPLVDLLPKSCRENSPDTLLGDSLLDPPQSLQKYPKRYQSPSRSGSPVMEAPEHLMCRSSTREDSARLHAGFDCDYERSRSRRSYEKSLTTSRRLEKCGKAPPQYLLEDGKIAKGLGRRCMTGFELTPKETEEVLNLLHQRNSGMGCKTRPGILEDPDSTGKSHSYNVWNTKEIVSQRVDLPSCSSSGSRKSEELVQSLKDGGGEKFPKDIHQTRFQSKHFQIVENQKTSINNNNDLSYNKEGGKETVSENIVNSKKSAKFDLRTSGSDEKVKFFEKLQQPKQANLNDDLVKQILQRQILMFKENADLQSGSGKGIPTAKDKATFRRSLDSATNMVFHCKTGLPLTSSPAPSRKGTCFDFDSSLTSVTAIKNALFEKEQKEESLEDNRNISALSSVTNSLLGSFEESVLNGRLEPVSTVEGFTAEIGASGSFCPRHLNLSVTVFFYTLSDADKVSTPYLGHINLGPKGYHVPKKGTIQVTLFNPHGTVVKMFIVMYDLSDMPINCQTFLRQRTLYMPVGAKDEDPDASKWLRYLLHLRFASSKSGRIYLHKDIRTVIFRKSDMDAATILGTYELRSFTRGPTNPKFSPMR